MDVVALTELATSLETEAIALADDLGVAVYEARQKLAVGLPSVVLATSDRARARSLLARLRARGHGAIACDGHAIVAARSMVPFRPFRFEADALVFPALRDGEGHADGSSRGQDPERVSYASLLALIRASHRHAFERHEETTEKKFRPAAALASGGVILTKTVKRDVVRPAEEREQVLYVFSRGRAPCLLRELSAQYAGLGDRVRPTRVENFLTTVRLLRERAPRAPYDDRLLSIKKLPEAPNDAGGPKTFDPETGGVDLLAHLLAMWLARGVPKADPERAR